MLAMLDCDPQARPAVVDLARLGKLKSHQAWLLKIHISAVLIDGSMTTM
jgi:hypothetical protein